MQMTRTIIAAAFGLGLAACSPKAEAPVATTSTPAKDAMAGMAMPSPEASPAVAAGPITSTGKITALDAATGKVTLDHQAIPAVGWGPMTMAFNVADPTQLKDLKVGDTVSFELKSAEEKTTITKVQKQ